MFFPRQLIAGVDYISASELLTFNSEITEASFNITIIDDDIVEGEETFFVGLLSVSDFEINVLVAEGTVVLIFDDDQPLPLGMIDIMLLDML